MTKIEAYEHFRHILDELYVSEAVEPIIEQLINYVEEVLDQFEAEK